MSIYEDEIRQALKAQIDAGRLKEAGAAIHVYRLLTKTYPRSSSKIDWSRVPGAIECAEEDRSRQTARFIEFFDKMCARFALNRIVFAKAASAGHRGRARSAAGADRAGVRQASLTTVRNSRCTMAKKSA